MLCSVICDAVMVCVVRGGFVCRALCWVGWDDGFCVWVCVALSFVFSCPVYFYCVLGIFLFSLLLQ